MGGGDYLIGVPARDLEGDEVGEDWMVLVLSGLYMEERAEYQEVLPEPTEGVSGDGDNQTN